MLRPSLHSMLAVTALGVAFAAAGLGRNRPATPAVAVTAAPAPVGTLGPFALAKLLAESPPDVVVIALDAPRHPLRFADPVALYGATDDAVVAGAPSARRIVLVGFDVVRVDRLARRMAALGRRVDVLAGGLESWDKTMDADPTPPTGSDAQAWQLHRENLALRRAFGDAPPTPVTPVAAPVAPVGQPGVAKKREGC